VSLSAFAVADWWASSREMFDRLFGNSSDPLGASERTLIRTVVVHLTSDSPLDYEGRLFSKLCISLACCCRLTGVQLAAAHWARAIADGTAVAQSPSETDGLRRAAVKELVDAGVLRKRYSDPQPSAAQRVQALHLAVQLFMRLLVAYALRSELTPDPGVKKFRRLLSPH
jgi:hypothetical protein